MDCNLNDVVDVVYAESRGEGETGMRAVTHVIMNRSKHQGKNPCIIVRQPNQFTRGIRRVNDSSWKLAKRIVLNPGKDITNGATYFHNLTVRPSWSYKLRVSFRFGNHIFYSR